MSLMIIEDCTSCAACEPQCPNQAISEDRKRGYYRIDPDRCTECVGFFKEPQCTAICPMDDVCVPDPKRRESRDELLAKKERLHPVSV